MWILGEQDQVKVRLLDLNSHPGEAQVIIEQAKIGVLQSSKIKGRNGGRKQ